MAYKVTRSQRVKEELELCNEHGEVVEVIEIDVDVDVILGEYKKRAKAFSEIEQQIKEVQKKGDLLMFEKTAQAYGEAIVNLFELLFGSENTERILLFYENRYIEMAVELIPFIQAVIAPTIKNATEKKKTQIKNMYSRSDRRRLGIR